MVANFVYAQSSDLILQGVLDLDLPTQGFTGKATHLVATNNISDLSIYGLGTASNGGGSDSIELTLPAISVNAGDDILLARDTNAIHLYFGSCFNSFEVIIHLLLRPKLLQMFFLIISSNKTVINLQLTFCRHWL